MRLIRQKQTNDGEIAVNRSKKLKITEEENDLENWKRTKLKQK